MENTSCPKCSATHAVSALTPPTYGDAVKTVLKDWRLWAIAFGVTLGLGMLSGGLGVGQSYVGALSGGIIGVTLWMFVSRLRRCPSCGAAFAPKGPGAPA